MCTALGATCNENACCTTHFNEGIGHFDRLWVMSGGRERFQLFILRSGRVGHGQLRGSLGIRGLHISKKVWND